MQEANIQDICRVGDHLGLISEVLGCGVTKLYQVYERLESVQENQ